MDDLLTGKPRLGHSHIEPWGAVCWRICSRFPLVTRYIDMKRICKKNSLMFRIISKTLEFVNCLNLEFQPPQTAWCTLRHWPQPLLMCTLPCTQLSHKHRLIHRRPWRHCTMEIRWEDLKSKNHIWTCVIVIVIVLLCFSDVRPESTSYSYSTCYSLFSHRLFWTTKSINSAIQTEINTTFAVA